MIKQRIFWCMQIFISPPKGFFGGKLKCLSVNPHQMAYHLKVGIKEEDWCKLEVSTMILGKVIAVQSLEFLNFISSVNNKIQRYLI
jgi:hypothetical protein